MQQGGLRKDLLYRLEVVTIQLPPLRQRKDDILVLARRILDREAKQFNQPKRTLSQKAATALLTHKWPGNVRELEQLIRRAIAIGEDDGPIQPRELFVTPEPMPTRRSGLIPIRIAEQNETIGDEEAVIIEALERHKWNRTKAAEELGMHAVLIDRPGKQIGYEGAVISNLRGLLSLLAG